jgi:hypothetical protein
MNNALINGFKFCVGYIYTKIWCTNFRLIHYASAYINDSLYLTRKNQYSIISKVMYCRLVNWNSLHRCGKSFVFAIRSRAAMVMTQPPCQWLPGTLTLGVKWLVHEDIHSTPSHIIVSRTWAFTSTFPIFLHSMVLDIGTILPDVFTFTCSFLHILNVWYSCISKQKV